VLDQLQRLPKSIEAFAGKCELIGNSFFCIHRLNGGGDHGA
jgi:hypothetical protein